MKMCVRDLKGLTVDDICLYVDEGDGEFYDLYKGSLDGVPEELWSREIGLIGEKKNLLDISVKQDK